MGRIFLLISVLLLTGCIAAGFKETVSAHKGNAAAICRALYENIDTVIDDAGARDYGSWPVKDFPYLRSTRLLASFSHELSGESPQWLVWVDHMADLDAHSRALELRNLPASARNRLKNDVLGELNSCRNLLIMTDLMYPQQHARLRDAVRVPDDYVSWRQLLGLYPITAPLVGAGISAWHDRTRDTFATPLTSLPVKGKLLRWIATTRTTVNASITDERLSAQQISGILKHSENPLGIPLPASAELEQLFATFAPIWEVDTVDENDHIGKIMWEKNEPIVDIDQPTFYRKISHTRFGNHVLLQLNYIVWFPARPGNDIYAGKLDGINWRVTLGPDGEPWLYDAIHNCGCYHEFFLSDRLRLRTDLRSTYFEAPLLPQPAPQRQPLVLRIAHHTHYIQRTYHEHDTDVQSPAATHASSVMMSEEYDALRSLPFDGGYRNLFGSHGLISGTERLERFILWPMGIRSPGAMRQWGRHATAFNGRRHFDDAFLFESLFEYVQ